MTKTLITAAAIALGALGTLFAPAAALAQDIRLSYEIQLDVPLPAITNIVTFNETAMGGGAWWASEVPANTLSHTITDPFPKSTDDAPLSALLVGLVQDLPGDAPGQKHVVLMMDSAAAQAASNIAWGTLFRNTLEEQLIAGIELATSGQPFEVIQPGLDVLSAFVEGDARNGILAPPGVPLSAWFSLGSVGPGDTASSGFTVMAFSTGQVIGQGTALVVSTVPEPGSTALMLAGLAVMGFVWRRAGAGRG